MIAEHDTSGFVYVMTNASMPGIVKIGKTERLPAVRARELFTTGVPVPFKVEFAIFSTDACQLELAVHDELEDFQVSRIREFFRLESSEAIEHILTVYLHDFDKNVVPFDLTLDTGDLARYAAFCGQHPCSIPMVIDHISPSAWKAASSRHDEWLSKQQAKRSVNIATEA